MILAEDRTTDEERQHIFNGKLLKHSTCEFEFNLEWNIDIIYIDLLYSVRRRNAAKKRKLNATDKTKSTDTEDESTFDDEGWISMVFGQTFE